MRELVGRRLEKYAKVKDVSMKTIAAPVVILLKNEEAPVLPKIVWLLPPPNAAPISAPLPVCNRTTNIRAMQTTT
jgi:hypothetical protein